MDFQQRTTASHRKRRRGRRLPVFLTLLALLPATIVATLAAAGAVTLVGGVGVARAQSPDDKPKPDARFGNVLFKTPDRAQWTRREEGGRLVFETRLPPPDFCTLTVFPGSKLTGDFRQAFDAAVAKELKRLGAGKIERDSGVQASKAREGFPVLQRTVVCEGKDTTNTIHWFLAGNPGDRFDMVAFQTSGEEQYKVRGQEATAFFYSVKLANSLEPGFHANGSSVTAAPAAPPKPATTPANTGSAGTTGTGAAASGPRLGKYHILSYGAVTSPPLHLGFFELRAGGKYRYLDNASKVIGDGTYSFDAGSGQVRWLSGPFQTNGWGGKFEIDREGKTHKIRLKSTTIGTNSTDSAG